MKALTPEQIEALKKLPETKPKGGRKSKTAIDTSIRTVTVWFKLPQKFGEEYSCSQGELCVAPNGPNRMVSEIGGRDICRFCFLAGVGL